MQLQWDVQIKQGEKTTVSVPAHAHVTIEQDGPGMWLVKDSGGHIWASVTESQAMELESSAGEGA